MRDTLGGIFSDRWQWASRMFGRARLGDSRNTRRLIAMAASAARSPGGHVSEVFRTDAERQGAYGLLENEAVPPEAINAAMADGTVRACVRAGLSKVYVAGDGSSIRVTDPHRCKGTGRIGSKGKARGFEVMSALALTSDGVPLGLCAQTFWARRGPPRRGSKRPPSQRESRYWDRLLDEVTAHFCNANEGASIPCRPHFLFDRGADTWSVLRRAHALRSFADVTVRAAQDRRVRDERALYLWEKLNCTAACCGYLLDVPGSATRTARRARMSVRASHVTLKLTGGEPIELGAVLVQEVDESPRGEEPIEWLLLTTQRLDTTADALDVVRGYCLRWRVEEFHKTWKSGLCKVESTQLRSGTVIQKWAMILGAVATRALHLTYAARTTPEVPAESEFSSDEIEAVIALRRPKGVRLDDRPSLQKVVRWIADLGGYTGKSSGGPPGAIVIGRGLRDVQAAASAIRNLREMKANKKL